jgi:glycerophosphoryl diester phosphodiesterase
MSRRPAGVHAALGMLVALACVTAAAQAFDLQGHRGARGLVAENTMAGFERAVSLGVTTLETDLALTKDGVVVITHDPLLNPDIVRGPDGRWLSRPGPPVRALTLDELRRYDVGRIDPSSKYFATWSAQQAVDGARMPRLSELFERATSLKPDVRFNIETKLSPLKPDDTVDPETFVRAVIDEVRRHRVAHRVTIQSFDWRTLRLVRSLAPDIATGCLTIDTPTNSTLRPLDGRPSPWLAGLDPASYGGSVPRTVAAAGCATWSPFWRNLTPGLVAEAHALRLKVIPWTVNDPAEMTRFVAMKVDGLITDFPDRAQAVLAAAR